MRTIVLSLLGIGVVSGQSSQITCEDGSVVGPVHIQFAEFIDTAAFLDESVRVAYREDVIAEVPEIISTFGSAVEFRTYYYNTKGPQHWDGCGWMSTPFLQSNEAEARLRSDIEGFGMTKINTRDTEYSSLTDAVYYSLRSQNAEWNKNEVDDNGIPILRIFSIGTDTATWVSNGHDAPQWPWDLGTTGVEDICWNHTYPSTDLMRAAYDEFPNKGSYFLILSHSNMVNSDIADVPSWYTTDFLGKDLGGAKGYSEALGADGRHVAQTVNLMKKMVCDYYRPTIQCDDGTVVGPVHIQFADFIDTAAFLDESVRVAYREDMIAMIPEIIRTFGSASEFQSYYYNTKGPKAREGCGWLAVDFGPSHEAEAKLRTDMEYFGMNKLLTRDTKYSSLSDVVYHSMRTNFGAFNKNEVDDKGLPIIRILSIGTDSATWVGNEDDANQWLWDLNDEHVEYLCYDRAYPTINNHLRPAYDEFPNKGTYFLVLSHSNMVNSDIADVPSWYTTEFLQNYLGGAKGHSEALAADGRHVAQSVDLMKKMVCDYYKTENTEAPPPTEGACAELLNDWVAFVASNNV